MSVNESCALNLDGTLKPASEINWVYSPMQESVQLPGTQPNSHGPTVQVFSVNPQPPAPPNQQSSQSVVGNTTKKRKQGRQGGESKAKKVENKGLGIQRILVNGLTQSGAFPHKTLPEKHSLR